VSSLGSTVAFDALRAGDLDVYVDYSGTIWATIMGRDVTSQNRDEVLHEVDRVLADAYDVQVVGPVGFENTYVLAMRRDDAATKNIRRISDLVRHAPRLVMGGDYEFFGRPEWTSLRDQYALEFESRRTMDSSLMYQALAQSEVDVISAYSTDGRISTFDLIMLEDDLSVIPPYDAIILVSDRLRIENPKVVEALADLVGTIDAAQMRDMNLAVNREGRTPAAVAADWLSVLPPAPPR
jgi:osmoprotectant transport system permease protein